MQCGSYEESSRIASIYTFPLSTLLAIVVAIKYICTTKGGAGPCMCVQLDSW